MFAQEPRKLYMRVIIAVILLSAIIGCEREPPTSKTAAPVQASFLSQDGRAPRSNHEQIESARSFVYGQKDQLDGTGLVVARYLERRFGESFDIDYATALSAEVQRCAESKFNAPALGLATSDEVAPDDSFVARAFQCQTHRLPDAFWDGVRHFTNDDPVGLDQVTFAVQIALEQACLDDEPQVRQIQQMQFSKLEEALSSLESPVDAAYLRRLAAWLYSAAGPVPEKWLARVRAAQFDSGGWAASQGAEKADPSTSAVGLWILLATDPDRKPVDVRFVEGRITPPVKKPKPYVIP